MPPFFLALILLFICEHVQVARAGFTAKAWQSQGQDFTFPEHSLPAWTRADSDTETATSNSSGTGTWDAAAVGVTFSGGGDRAFVTAIGALAGFHELGFVSRVGYMAGSSGGSWATAVYSYYQNSSVSDSVLLGPVVQPDDIEYEDMSKMDPKCVRSFTNHSGVALSGVTFAAWQDSIQNVFFTPSGITRGAPFSYDSPTVADIKARNPDLQNVEFQLLRGNFGENNSMLGIDKRPFPIIQGTLIGPESMVPWLPANRNYTLMEWTPLTAGVAYTSDMVFTDINNTQSKIKTVGGFVEPYATNGNFRPSIGLPADATEGLLTVPGPSTINCDIALACGTSSWVPGTASAASTNPIVQITIGELKYWAPSASKPSQQYEAYAVGDGAGVSNTNFISLLQRNVSTILAFISSSTPLQNSTNWNPAKDNLTEDSIDFTVPAWFGKIPVDLQVVWDVGFDLPNSHIFSEDEWLPFITGMQAAQAKGNGNVLSMTHTTVSNSKYGIEAGRKVKVVWTYLGRALNWENQLSDQMKSLVTPATDPYNQASLMEDGPFKSFPNYGTAIANIDIEKANLLGNFAGWLVYQNENIFRDALGLPLIPDENNNLSSGDDDGEFSSSTEGILVITFAVVLVVLVVVLLTYRVVSSQRKVSRTTGSDDAPRSSEMSGTLVRKGEVLSNMA